MFQSEDQQFNQVKTFHRVMDGESQETVQPYNCEYAGHRADFKIEEIVEFIHATAANQEVFTNSLAELHTAIDKAAAKITSKKDFSPSIVGQIDALVDLLYLTYGSFALMGVDPKPFFDIVHVANMGKIFPDGTAHYHPVTHKILKPDDWEEKYAPEGRIAEELERQKNRKKSDC